MIKAYLKIDGIPGECLEKNHKDWVEIQSFTHHIRQPASVTAKSAGGATSGGSQHDDYAITKLMDKASPLLYQFCCSGKHIGNIVLHLVRKSGDSDVVYMEVTLEEAIVSTVTPGAHISEEFPTESVTFNYGKIKWAYTQQQRAGGTVGGKTPAGWDLTEDKVYA
jgi:type VI secretion system secreted protein Hcp